MTWLSEWVADSALAFWSQVVRFAHRHLGWPGSGLAIVLPPAVAVVVLWLFLR